MWARGCLRYNIIAHIATSRWQRNLSGNAICADFMRSGPIAHLREIPSAQRFWEWPIHFSPCLCHAFAIQRFFCPCHELFVFTYYIKMAIIIVRRSLPFFLEPLAVVWKKVARHRSRSSLYWRANSYQFSLIRLWMGNFASWATLSYCGYVSKGTLGS